MHLLVHSDTTHTMHIAHFFCGCAYCTTHIVTFVCGYVLCDVHFVATVSAGGVLHRRCCFLCPGLHRMCVLFALIVYCTTCVTPTLPHAFSRSICLASVHISCFAVGMSHVHVLNCFFPPVRPPTLRRPPKDVPICRGAFLAGRPLRATTTLTRRPPT